MQLAVGVDPELCIGSEECVRIAPGAFRIDPALGISVPLDAAATATGPARIALLAARRSCPTGAIGIAGQDGESLPDDADQGGSD